MLCPRDIELREAEINQCWHSNRKLRLIAVRVENRGIGKPYDIILHEVQLVQDVATHELFTRALNGPSLTIVKEIEKINWEFWTKVQEFV